MDASRRMICTRAWPRASWKPEMYMIYVSMCMCAYIYIYIYIYIRTHTHIFTHTHTHAHSHNLPKEPHEYTYIHTNIHIYIYIHTHNHIHIYFHVRTHTHTHTHTPRTHIGRWGIILCVTWTHYIHTSATYTHKPGAHTSIHTPSFTRTFPSDHMSAPYTRRSCRGVVLIGATYTQTHKHTPVAHRSVHTPIFTHIPFQATTWVPRIHVEAAEVLSDPTYSARFWFCRHGLHIYMICVYDEYIIIYLICV